MVLVGALAALIPGVAHASIQITYNSTYTKTNDGSGSSDFDYFAGMTVPTSTTLTASAGGNSSNTTIDWSTSGGQTTLFFDMEHLRTGTQGSYSRTSGYLYFTATADATYALSGDYQVDDDSADDSGIVVQGAYLYDQTANESLFKGYQDSRSTHDEQFTLGGMDGDYYYSLDSGSSLTGNLIAGHQYLFDFGAIIHAYPTADSGASAEGNFTLTITDNSAVPEPLSLLVWVGLASVAGLVTYRRTRRN
jgi:hypothetical protein